MLKDNKLKAFLETNSGCEQVSKEARERVGELFEEMLLKVAEAAGKSATAQGLTRLMGPNIDDGFNAVLGQSKVAPDPPRFLEAMHKMSISQLGEVLRLIAEWTHNPPEKAAAASK